VIPNILLAGAYPTSENIEQMKDLKISTIICLMTESDLDFIGNYHINLPIKNFFKFVHCPIEGILEKRSILKKIFVL
jgi:hypothetical protein